MSPEARIQPVVGGQIVMTRRQVRVVVDRHRVFPEAAWRLHHQHQVARLHRGDDDFAIRIIAAVDEQLPRRRAPMLGHRIGQLGWERGKPAPIVLGGYPDRVTGKLTFGEPVRILAAALDQRVDQRVAIGRFDTGQLAHLVPTFAHGPQQRHRTGGGVQADRVADARMLGRVSREHQRHPFVGGVNAAQSRVPQRQARDPVAALRIGDIGDQAVVVDLLERERNCDDAAVELRYRDLSRDVERGQSVIVGTPLRPRAGQAQPLKDRNIQGRKVFHVPAVVIAARGRGCRLDPTGGQHGDHHGIGTTQRCQQLRLGGAQRGAVHRKRMSARGFDRRAQRLHIGGVAGQVLRAVVQHGNGGTGAAGIRSPQHPPGRDGNRRAETNARHQHGVAKERVQLAQVVHAPLRQVDVRLQRDTRLDRGTVHQLRVSGLLAADHDRGDAGGQHGLDAVLPGPVAAENPHHHDRGVG